MNFLRVLGLGLALAACSRPHHRTVRVAAAADLTRAFDELGRAFEAKTGIEPIFNFGSSGLLAEQIANGAPYALFVAANEGYARQAVISGHCDGHSLTIYARGELVLWTPEGVAQPTRMADLADPRFRRIAIANPDHAPYGAAAKQVLERTGVWAAVESRVVLGENVQAAMSYAVSGAVDAAFVGLSVAAVHGGQQLPIDPQLYDPLDQALVVCGTGAEADAAEQLAAFIGSREGREIMNRYGFLLPSERTFQH